MKQDGRKETILAADRLRKKGENIIALACTGFSTIRIADEIRKAIRFPIADAVEAAGWVAWHAIRTRIDT